LDRDQIPSMYSGSISSSLIPVLNIFSIQIALAALQSYMLLSFRQLSVTSYRSNE